MSKLKIAIQKSGRLSEKSLELLKDCGIKISTSNRKLRTESSNFPIEVLFLRDDDIPQYVEQGVADIGILGENEVWEKDKDINNVRKLGFAGCKLCLAIPKDEVYTDLSYFENKKIATSYPRILGNFFQEKGINVKIEEIGGSVEIAPSIGLANAIFDIVSTGSTLLTNGLKQVETVVESEAILVANKNLDTEKQAILDRLMFRIEAVKQSSENKYILLNAPNDKLEEIIGLLPGMKSPTVLPLAEKGWSSIHTVVKEDTFWDIIEQLKELGAEGILVLEIEKMIL
ncbi:ATP phosphoribosyltransferase [Chishuiella sp.]|uniref:ATP phosphoribosyltransferase n=1 Tax=Chishuiella sp. TaxID=1969467 RepID=UPI0028AA356B|nr:ATP phosphoribosyltransferase [Chishuiella sp.]